MAAIYPGLNVLTHHALDHVDPADMKFENIFFLKEPYEIIIVSPGVWVFLETPIKHRQRSKIFREKNGTRVL